MAILASISYRKLISAGLLGLLIAAGCSSSKKTESSSSSTATPSTSTATPSSSSESSLNSAAVSYVGGKAQKATGSTIEIGWVNADTGLEPYPWYTSAVKLAVDYANTNLNGIGGHVIKLDTCSMASEEDGQSCGTQMVNNSNITAILEGIIPLGTDSFFKVINNTKPVLQVDANSPADFNPYPGNTHPNVFSLNPTAAGGYTAQIQYAGKYANPPIKTMTLIGINVPAVRTGITSFENELAAFHITTKATYINPGAGASEVASEIQIAGGATSDAWFILSDINTCINIMTYKQSAGLHPLIMGAQCTGAAMKPLTGGAFAPNGLITVDNGWSYFLPQEHQLQQLANNQVNTIPNDPSPDGAATGWLTAMNLFRAMNATATDLSTQSISNAIKGLQPPIAGNIGPINCGAVANFPTACGNMQGLIQARGSSWVRLSPTSQIPAFQVWQFQS